MLRIQRHPQRDNAPRKVVHIKPGVAGAVGVALESNAASVLLLNLDPLDELELRLCQFGDGAPPRPFVNPRERPEYRNPTVDDFLPPAPFTPARKRDR